MAFPTSANQVQAFAGALYGVQIGTVTMAQVTSDIAAVGGLSNALNSYYAASFGSLPTSAIAASMAANLGLTGAALTNGAAYVEAQLNATPANARGALISNILNLFAGLSSDATYGAAATAWNAKVASAAAYSGATNVAMGSTISEGQSFALTANAPVVSEGNSGNKTITFELTLDRAPTEAVTFQALTLAGTATADEDYIPLATSVTFAAGQRVATVSVSVVGDTAFEANETFTLRLTGDRLAAPVVATGTITNDDLNPGQSQIDAYAAAKVAADAAKVTADAAVLAAQTGSVALTAAQAAVVDLATAQAFVTAATAAATSAATAQTAAAAQVTAAQAQLVAAGSTASTADDVEAQAAVVTAQAAAVSAATVVAAAQTAAPLAAQAVIDYTTSNLNMHASNVQTLAGSLGDDVFVAEAGEINGDQINGRGGNDTLLITGTQSDTDPDRVVVLTSVETIKIDGADPAVSVGATLDITGTTGLANVQLVDTAAATIANAASLLNVVMESSAATQRAQTATITYAAAAVTGTATVQSISLNNANATVNANGIESLNISATGASNVLAGTVGAGATSITATGSGSVNLTSVDNVATSINASALVGAVTVTAGVAASISGGQGADNITGSGANDTINGGAGNDTIVAGAGNDAVDSGEGNDNITASSGNNVIYAGAGTDTITLGTGFDFVDAGEGNDTIVGGSNLDGLDVVRGGSGVDTLRISGISNDVFLQSVSGVEQFEFTSALNTTNYKMVLAPSTGVSHFLSTGALDDAFNATTGGFTTGLTFNMGGGEDTLTGGAGNDTFSFEGSWNLETTGSRDIIDGGAGNNQIVLDGSNGDVDAYIEPEYVDNISTISVTAGDATDVNIVLDIYSDVAAINYDETEEIITVDAAALTDSSNSLDMYVEGSGSWAVSSAKKFNVIGGAGADLIETGLGDDTIHGGNGDDEIDAGEGANYVDGGAGEDTITVDAASTVDGGTGRDYVTGSSDADVLRGGAGSDIIFGNGGNDTLTGGADSDIFIVNSNASADTVTVADFNTAQDRIVMKTITASGTDTVTFRGTANSFANAQAAISAGDGVYEAVFQSDNNTLWIDSNNDGTLNANDTKIVLQGVTNLAAANVSSVVDSALPTLTNTLLDIDASKTLFSALPNAVFIVKDAAADVYAALTVGGDAPTPSQLTARALTASTLAQALQVRFDTAPTPQQLLAVAAVTNSELVYTGITAASPDDLLLLSGTRFADSAMAVTLTGTVSLAQAAAVDAAWGTLTLTSLTDTAPALSTDADTNTGAGTYVAGTVAVTVSGTAALAQLANIDGNTSGAITYTSVTDTAANFATGGTLTTAGAAYVTSGKNVTVTTTASLAQLGALNTANGSGTLTYTSVTDTASTLNTDASTNAGAGTYVLGTVNVTVSNAATLAQLANIDGNTTGTLSYASVTDTAAHYASDAGVLTGNATTYVTPGKNVEVTDAATLAQLVIVDTSNGVEVDGADEDEDLDWTFSYSGITDTAANIASTSGVLTSAAQTYVNESQTVNITTNVNVAQINAIDAATDGAITFDTVEDTAANLFVSDDLDGAGDNDIEDHDVIITDAATAAQFNAIQSANGTGTVSVNRILASTSADIVDLATQVIGDQNVVYTNGLQAATAVFSNASDSTQLMASDTFTLAGVDVLTLDSGDTVDLSAFNLSGQALVTDLTVNGTTIRDGSWMIVAGEYNNAGTFRTGDANTSGYVDARLLLWDGNSSGGVGAVNMQGVVIVGTSFTSADLILLA